MSPSELAKIGPPPAAEAARLRKTFGVWVFLISDSMFFIGLIGVYLVLRASSPTWPPAGIERPSLLSPSINAIVLVLSSVSLVRALAAIRANRQAGFRFDLTVAVLLGISFVIGQVFEAARLSREGLTLTGSTMGNVLYTLAGFHAVHVVAGLAILTVVLLRALRGEYTAANHFGVVGAGMFWHFLTATWLVLFTLLFLL